MLKVAHLSCGVTGGADIAAVRIHRALQHAGVQSRFYHLDHASIDESFTKFHAPAGIASIVANRIKMYRHRYLYGQQKPGTETFTSPWGNFPLEFKDLQFPDVDVITFHWIAAFIDLKRFLQSVPSHVKFVWAMHDLNPITGGCHYTNGCRKFESECKACPQLDNTGALDLAQKNFRIKKELYKKYLSGRCHIIPDGEWVAKEVRSSELLSGEMITPIHYPIETELFRQLDQRQVRDVLGLDDDKFVLLFGSGALDNRRKGMDLLVDAISGITDKTILQRIQLITFGSGKIPELGNIPTRNFGRVTSPEFLRQLYSAADFFIMPSREEALGQTAMESLCCGTPVISFAVGGLLDTIDESNGLFAKDVSAESLREAIVTASTRNFDRKLISDKARARYGIDRKSKEYLAAFNVILNRK